MKINYTSACLLCLFASFSSLAEQAIPETSQATTIKRYSVKEARQAVAVDGQAFYAINNQTIVKMDKNTGRELARWQGEKEGPLSHLDSGVVYDGKLYAAHTNYPQWPMTSSVEIWDTATLAHVSSYSFGIDRGSLTWIDRDANGVWWGTFANYNRVFGKSSSVYGNKYNTQLVRFDDKWQVQESWVFPDALIDLFDDMSNSGGSWGKDGKLYITGHDNPAIYVLEIPKMGSVLNWVNTIKADISGQGIAYDRSVENKIIYGIVRRDNSESEITVNQLE